MKYSFSTTNSDVNKTRQACPDSVIIMQILSVIEMERQLFVDAGFSYNTKSLEIGVYGQKLVCKRPE